MAYVGTFEPPLPACSRSFESLLDARTSGTCAVKREGYRRSVVPAKRSETLSLIFERMFAPPAELRRHINEAMPARSRILYSTNPPL
jgi:hypothetical protein